MNKHIKFVLSNALLWLPGLAFAHIGQGMVEGFAFGLWHPLLGLDHLLVMTGLGLWLSRQSLRYGLLGITAFLAAMGCGAALAMVDWCFPYVETAILLSVLLTGVLLLTSARSLSSISTIGLIVVVAAMHGQAHGSELPLNASVLTYLTGFLLMSMALLVSGLVCGLLSRRYRILGIRRLYGGLTSIAGLWLLLIA